MRTFDCCLLDWIWLMIRFWYIFFGAWLTEESYLILYNYIKWWSFIEIVEIEMESEWIDEWKLKMYDMNFMWCVGIVFSGKKTSVRRNRMCIV